jgi:hypothetical protein
MASNGVGSGADALQAAIDERAKKNAAFEKLKTKDGIQGGKLLARLDELDKLIPELELRKDEPEPLAKGCKTFLSGVYAYEKYHKWNPSRDIGSRATEKGKEVEPEALALVSILDGLELVKNEDRIENEWFSGLPDAIEVNDAGEVIIHDVKCPENIETYFAVIGKELIWQYYWQMQGYMDLTGAKIAKIHYCLINTPIHQLKDSAAALLRRMNVISEYSPEYIEAEKQLINNLTYDDIPLQEKKWTIIVERNDEDILNARKRVEMCREHLVEFEKIHLGLVIPEFSRNLSYETSEKQE